MDTILVKEGSQFIPWIVRSKIVLVFLLDVSRQFQMNLRCLTHFDSKDGLFYSYFYFLYCEVFFRWDD